MQLTYQYGEEQIVLDVEPAESGWRVRLPDGTEHMIFAGRLPGNVLQVRESAKTFEIAFARSSRGLEIAFSGQAYLFTDAAANRLKRSRAASSGTLTAPMVGVVADVLVQVGDTVEAYQPIAVVSAMKVYATVEAPFGGTVKAIHVRKEDRVEHGALLAEIEPTSHEAQP